MMKNFLFLLLTLTIISSCNKESTSKAPAAGPALEATDRESQCGNPVCSIRIDLPYAEVNVLNLFKLKKNYTNTTWIGVNTTLGCPVTEMIDVALTSGVWCPITIEEGVQYQLEYTHKMPCKSGTLSAINATFSIKTATQTVTFPLHTGNTAATNPDIVYFARYGCVVSEGEIE